MNTRQKLTLAIAAIFMVTLTIVGVTYAYFVTQVQNNPSTPNIQVGTASLGVTYGDGNDVVTLTDVLPGTKVYKTFTVTNSNSTQPVPFTVYVTSTAGDKPFIHSSGAAVDTTCYNKETYDDTDVCFAGNNYDNIKVQVKKYTGDTAMTSKDQTALAAAFAAEEATAITGGEQKQLVSDTTQLGLGTDTVAGKTEENVVNNYILEVEYVDTHKNQNLENKAEVTIKVSIK